MPESSTTRANRLAEETSPYLLQHRHNPVDWYPWGEAALARAKTENKPILLSVGYAACHWCHVMAHESFEDPQIAALMNALFVNIKVDREERPDLDTIYQSALALLGEQGGWPLTMFLTPEGEPFWGGTYFPPEPRYGRPGFPQLLRGIDAAYRDDPQGVETNVTALRTALQQLSDNRRGGSISLEAADKVAEQLVRQFDPFHGGLGQAPKFPQPSILKQLWRAWRRRRAEPFRQAVELTLSRMCQGGIYDHLGGGFARYAVDQAWLVPHFEKMLYDNAQLVELLTWAWQETGNPLYAQRVRETVTWLQREMMAAADAEGRIQSDAFASSLDADSEGEEGKFYVWSEAEIDQVLGDDSALFKAAYDVTPSGNWEGKTILNRSARPLLGSEAEEARLAALRDTLLQARGKRVRPGWDDKVLADWNGLMIAALARAAPVFGEPGWLEMAAKTFRFVCETMSRDERLLHSWRRGKLQHPATLDDYANLCDAALALFEATSDAAYLERAEAWVALLDRHYWDQAGGGYFFTADDTKQLIVRSKTAQDSATPAGNGTLVAVLAQLFYLTGKDDYRRRAEEVIAAFSGELERNYFTLSTLINAAEGLQSGIQIVVVGARGDSASDSLIAMVHEVCLPDRVVQILAPGDSESLPPGHPALGKDQDNGRATAYVCRGAVCSLPIIEAAELKRALAI